jgi:subtilisin family serine protease
MNMQFARTALLVIAIMFASSDGLTQQRIPARSGAGERKIIPGRFIVTLTDDADPAATARENGVTPDRVYQNVFKGFAGSMAEAAREGLLRDRRVRRVEPDAVVTVDAIGWGQDRIDQRRLPLDNIYKKNYTGQGVTAYIVDGGINYQHVEFGGRASFGYDAYGGNGSDCAGHGTHVAGTVGGATYGVAPGVSLVSVRVMDCSGSGTMSGVIAGLDWIAANMRKPAVVNLSLGGPATQAMDDACVRLMNAGALVVAAAGNENTDACNTSPARTPDILTVGASDQNDVRASFSNYGSCLDLFAPGVMITSAWYSSTTALAYMDGTSMATPAVAGAAALMLQHYPSIAARALRDSITNHSTKGVITGALSTKNHLLYSLEANDGVVSVPTTPTNTPPTAAFTQSCSNLACSFADRSTDVDGSIVAWRWDFGNGATSSVQNPSNSYATAGTYTVRLTVTDNAGATASTSAVVTVSAPVVTNLAPVARFTTSCTSLACTFTDQSYDNDGTIAAWRWDFGNGVTSTTRNPSYSYPAAGTYTVRLTVTDNAGATGTIASSVTVSAPAPSPTPSGISLSVSIGKSRGNYNTTLRWSGATTSTVDIYRNNVKIRTMSNTGSYTETLPRGSYTYRVCDAGSTNCSPDRTVSF